jgi:hypothetical protein
MGMVVIIILAVMGLFVIVAGIKTHLKYRFGKPSDFAAGIARSLRSDTDAWAYDGNENWLMCQKAPIAISVQSGNYGEVTSTQKSNAGSLKITQFNSADARAFDLAYWAWREQTAMERTMVVERRKRDALQALAA